MFSDHSNQIQRLENGVPSPVPGIESLITWSRFVVRDNQLYILTGDDNLMRYDLDNSTLTHLLHYPDTSISVTDVSPTHDRVLISKQMSARKEIVLLSP